MTPNDEFDQILHDALAEYREAEPLAGLEERVLRRLRLRTERQRKLWWGWIAITAAAALAIAASIGLSDRVRQNVAAPSMVQQKAPKPRTTATQAANEHPSRRLPAAKTVSNTVRPVPPQLASAEPVPMHERFPSPTPLKPEERMLLALATTHPEILVDKHDDGEVVITPISIKPLVDETGSYQGEN